MINQIKTNLPTYAELTGKMYEFEPFPLMLHRSDGRTAIVKDAEERDRMLAKGWELKPVPPPIEPEDGWGPFPRQLVNPQNGSTLLVKDLDTQAVYLAQGWRVKPPEEDEEDEAPRVAKRRGRPPKVQAEA